MAPQRSGRPGRPAARAPSPEGAAAVAALAAHHGVPVPPDTWARALALAAPLAVLPDSAEARALDLIDQALGHRRLAGASGPLEPDDLARVAELWTRGADTP